MSSRRSFIRNMGAGLSAAVASTAVMAGAGKSAADDPAIKAALLEEEQALRRLHLAFVQAMDKGQIDEVIGMFADDARVLFNGGVFIGRSEGVSRLFRVNFQAGKTGGTMQPAPGFELDSDRLRDSVAVSTDRISAAAVFPFSIQVGVPLESETSLASLARLHGEGVQTWWEGGVYRVAYRKDAAGGWKIGSLEYDTLIRADYRAGRSYAKPISVSRLATRFPEDGYGPDELV